MLVDRLFDFVLTFNCLIISTISQPGISFKQPRRQEFPVCSDAGCQQGIDSAVDYTTSLHSEQATELANLRQQVKTLEDDYYVSISTINDLLKRVSDLEVYLPGNVTTLNNRITEETRLAVDTATGEVEFLRSEVTPRLNSLAADVNMLKNNQNTGGGGGGDQNAVIDVYFNLTRRIDSLEFGRIANLTGDNTIWRRNFRIVNSTFEKIKMSGNCLCK